MIGVLRDPIFGPVITFGAGGFDNEIFSDRSVALPPLNKFLAKDLIESTRASKILDQFHNMPPVDRDALKEVLLCISETVCELPWIMEMDLNPLIVDENGAIAADARIVIDHATAPAATATLTAMSRHSTTVRNTVVSPGNVPRNSSARGTTVAPATAPVRHALAVQGALNGARGL